MKKLVVRLELEDGKAKQKALKTVSTLQGIDAITVDMKEKKMMVIGSVDAVKVVSKLRKYWETNIITLGPAKEPEKKEEAKPAAAAAGEEGKKEEGGQKEEAKKEGQKAEEGNGKKEEGKKEEGKKEEGKKEDEPAKKQPPQPQPQPQPQAIPEHVMELIRARQQQQYNNPYFGQYPYMANPYMMNQHHPQMHPPTYYVQSVEENPNGCAIF